MSKNQSFTLLQGLVFGRLRDEFRPVCEVSIAQNYIQAHLSIHLILKWIQLDRVQCCDEQRFIISLFETTTQMKFKPSTQLRAEYMSFKQGTHIQIRDTQSILCHFFNSTAAHFSQKVPFTSKKHTSSSSELFIWSIYPTFHERNRQKPENQGPRFLSWVDHKYVYSFISELSTEQPQKSASYECF